MFLHNYLLGARISEIRGLCWKDVIEEKSEIHFKTNYTTAQQFELNENGEIVAIGTKSEYTSLKSNSSDRIIGIDEELLKILRFHKVLQQNFAKRSKVRFSEKDPVFTGKKYAPLGKNTTNSRVKKVMKDLQIKDWEELTSHCLRKSFCCAGILNDVPIEYMSKMLGHSSVKVTEQYYLEFNQNKLDEFSKQANVNRTNALKNCLQINL